MTSPSYVITKTPPVPGCSELSPDRSRTSKVVLGPSTLRATASGIACSSGSRSSVLTLCSFRNLPALHSQRPRQHRSCVDTLTDNWPRLRQHDRRDTERNCCRTHARSSCSSWILAKLVV